jgi:CHAT domain-containing protein
MSVRAVSAAQLTAWASAVRKSLDPGRVETVAVLPAFDVEAAHRLYRELLEPVRAGWQGARTLVVIPHRALAHVPFALLVTQAKGVAPDEALRFDGYRRVPWLIEQAAIVQLPAATSLVTLARLPRANDGRRAFIGFGDPVFAAGQAGSAPTRGVALRNLELSRRPDGVAPSFTQLPALPDTREEIRDIGRLLGADAEKEVIVGLAANEERVRREDLRSHRVVAFATHGLVAGDLEGLEEPALALSHPALAGVAGDGLLDMTEILGLRLDADWVVLSACNTAAAGPAGEEALSGLGRAFFHAGARALLVSNWPVETVSARLLTTEVFRRQASNPQLARAQALREAMLQVLHHGTSKEPRFAYAHPLFWAPFSLVGDGG